MRINTDSETEVRATCGRVGSCIISVVARDWLVLMFIKLDSHLATMSDADRLQYLFTTVRCTAAAAAAAVRVSLSQMSVCLSVCQCVCSRNGR